MKKNSKKVKKDPNWEWSTQRKEWILEKGQNKVKVKIKINLEKTNDKKERRWQQDRKKEKQNNERKK